MTSDKQLHLNLFIYPDGHHEAAWRHPDSRAPSGSSTSPTTRSWPSGPRPRSSTPSSSPTVRRWPRTSIRARFRLEPITLLTAIAASTARIGLIGTASTTYTEPYNLARQLRRARPPQRRPGGLEHRHHRRRRRGAELRPRRAPARTADRYDRAEEFVDVVTALWDTLGGRCRRRRPARAGIFADPDKIHRIDHVGKHFRVRGPLNAPRSPQGRPVYVQAGSSPRAGVRGAVGRGDLHRAPDAGGGAGVLRRHQARAQPGRAAAGPAPGAAGHQPVHRGHGEGGRGLHQEFNELTQPGYSLDQLNRLIGVDLSAYDLDEPFPREVIRTPMRSAARAAASSSCSTSSSARTPPSASCAPARRRARPPGRHRHAGPGRRHNPGLGRVRRRRRLQRHAAMADRRDRRVHRGGRADPARRGLFRTEYTGTTLRDHLGLERPASQYAPHHQEKTA